MTEAEARGQVAAILEAVRPGRADEILAALDRYVALLGRWQATHNLVAPATVSEIWSRHVLDSAQLLAIRPDARRWIDLGSGAGFPGLVVAIALAGEPGAQVTLVESSSRKAAFLRRAAAEAGAPATVLAERIETAFAGETGGPDHPRRFDVVTSRALAPLDRLIDLAAPLLSSECIALFHKGGGYAGEVASALQRHRFDLLEHPSRTDPNARILEIRLAPQAGRSSMTP